jgi:hypothetical protein
MSPLKKISGKFLFGVRQAMVILVEFSSIEADHFQHGVVCLSFMKDLKSFAKRGVFGYL